jgi:hypothetical protein
MGVLQRRVCPVTPFSSPHHSFTLDRQPITHLCEEAADDEAVPLRDAYGVLVDQLVELAGDGPEVEVSQALALAVTPDLLQGRDDGADVGACTERCGVVVGGGGEEKKQLHHAHGGGGG